MLKLNYCTCGRDKKRIFSNLFLGIGVGIHAGLIAGVCMMLPGFYFLFAVLLVADVWWYLYYYKQARHLRHSKSCARRYAILASLANNKALSDGYSDHAK